MRIFYIFLSVLVFSFMLSAKDYRVHSPNKRIAVTVTAGQKIYYSVSFDKKPVITSSPISLTVEPGGVLGHNPVVTKAHKRSFNQRLKPVVPQKNAVIIDRFNRLTLRFKGRYRLVFRAYDDGVAYRFVLAKGRKKKIKIMNEEVVFSFASDHHVWFPREDSMFTHQERMYRYLPLRDIEASHFCSLPALVDIKNGPKVALLEADLLDYPGMYLRGSGGTTLTGIFPGVALKEETVDLKRRGGDRNIKVLKYAGYKAVTSGQRSLPWRVMVIAEHDTGLVESEMVFKLASPLRLKDTGWIKPGKVAWDWWNFNNIYGVDFKAGINTETYKYYIDFAAKYGIQYIVLDEGWYELGDLTKINRDIDMPGLMAYAKKKNVGIILWVIWKTLDDQLDITMDQFEKWGVKGIKVDFMQRDDQWMVNYYYRIAKEAAKRKMLVDFHGSYTPRGLRRAFPNVLTREGVKGLEHYKWKSEQGPEHELMLPFIRMLAGPMDFTPGAMLNAQKADFGVAWNRPMSKGTRCRQLAMYVVYESPLQMLADNPTHYYREPECMEFLSKVPVTWDETRVLKAKIGDYIAIARRKGDEWYIGAMTDWTPRDMELPLDFLGEGTYTADMYRDGLNAHRSGNDFKRTRREIKKGETLHIHLAPGGGFAARITKK